jgi:peptidyl-prolyl cis-trans isomerase B (cyclophilin B)
MAKQKQNLSKAAQERLKNYEIKSQVVRDTKTDKKQDNQKAIVVSVVAILVAIGLQFSYSTFGPGKPVASSTPLQTNSADVPKPALAENRDWTGSLKLNDSKLDFTLDGKAAPQAVANFVSLAKKGFFEKTSCHRLTTSGLFVLQCGDPTGTGTGGPGYNWGPVENEPKDDIYRSGMLAMARVGNDGYSMGSQFFIVYNNSTLPRDTAGGYTVFGEITKGLQAVEEIASDGVAGGTGDGKPSTNVVLSKISVE